MYRIQESTTGRDGGTYTAFQPDKNVITMGDKKVANFKFSKRYEDNITATEIVEGEKGFERRSLFSSFSQRR